jgi:transcriptional regulator with XRE-family HTH domain
MSNLLKAWLKEKGRGSAAQLSRDTGLSKAYISELASGKCGQRMTAKTAKALQVGTGISALVWLGLETSRGS